MAAAAVAVVLMLLLVTESYLPNNGEYHEEQAEEDMFLDEGDLAEELEIDEAEQEAQLQRGFPETRAAVILARRKPSKKATLEPTAGRSKSGRAYAPAKKFRDK
mmetsp:Transcript_83513/g.162458  ORF Transcript_83513/g.162458 Transcript_83513/m.162458 type:complete len:104 (+) Transcript_83513:659-970(+)